MSYDILALKLEVKEKKAHKKTSRKQTGNNEETGQTLTRGLTKSKLETEYLSSICSDPTQTVAAGISYPATDKHKSSDLH